MNTIIQIKKLDNLINRKNIFIDNDTNLKLTRKMLGEIYEKTDEIIPKLNKSSITDELVYFLHTVWKDVSSKKSCLNNNDSLLNFIKDYYDLYIICINERLNENIKAEYTEFVTNHKIGLETGNG